MFLHVHISCRTNLVELPWDAPAARVILSFIREPPMSLHPAASRAFAPPGPIFTQDACTVMPTKILCSYNTYVLTNNTGQSRTPLHKDRSGYEVYHIHTFLCSIGSSRNNLIGTSFPSSSNISTSIPRAAAEKWNDRTASVQKSETTEQLQYRKVLSLTECIRVRTCNWQKTENELKKPQDTSRKDLWTCILVMKGWSARRATECIKMHSRIVGPFLALPLMNTGAWKKT